MKLSAYMVELQSILTTQGDINVVVNASDRPYNLMPGLTTVEPIRCIDGRLCTVEGEKTLVIG